MTVIFNTLPEVVEVHVRAKFHRTKCSGLLIIVLTEKKTVTMLKTILSLLVIKCHILTMCDNLDICVHWVSYMKYYFLVHAFSGIFHADKVFVAGALCSGTPLTALIQSGVLK